MDKIQDAIVEKLKGRFPEMAGSILPFGGLLDEQTDNQISYPAPGILVCILPAQEAPEGIAPWEIQGEFGLVLAVKEASAKERHKKGWRLCMKVAEATYRNTWGISPSLIRPAIITGIYKTDPRNPDGTPTGTNYWTVTFYNWLKFEALF